MKYVIVIIYLMNAGAYLFFSPELKDKYPYEFAAWYFGSEGVFISILLYLAVSCNHWIERQLIIVTAGFIFIRAMLYILNYTLIFTVNARMHMAYLALYSLICIVPTFISAYRHGLFKN